MTLAGGGSCAQIGAVTKDGKILPLFHEWMAARRIAQALSDRPNYDEESDEANAADDRKLTRAITDTPAEGAAGRAIKNYTFRHLADFSRCSDAAALSSDVWHDTDYEGHEDARLQRAILEDVVRLMPELAPLAAAAIEGAGHAEIFRKAEAPLPL